MGHNVYGINLYVSLMIIMHSNRGTLTPSAPTVCEPDAAEDSTPMRRITTTAAEYLRFDPVKW